MTKKKIASAPKARKIEYSIDAVGEYSPMPLKEFIKAIKDACKGVDNPQIVLTSEENYCYCYDECNCRNFSPKLQVRGEKK